MDDGQIALTKCMYPYPETTELPNEGGRKLRFRHTFPTPCTSWDDTSTLNMSADIRR